jgi:LemA protein
MTLSFGSLWGIIVIIVLLVYFIMIYNNLVQLNHNVDKAWANIDVLLKQRHDELPKLVDACSEYMEFEQSTLQDVTAARYRLQSARESGDIKLLGSAEASMRDALGRLFAVAENYPQLKTSETFNELQKRISFLEDAIADRREFYNDSVNINNARTDQFPDLIIARLFGFFQFELLSIEPSDMHDVNLKKLFKK